MNWKQVLVNASVLFAGGYATAMGAGATPKAGLALGLGAVLSNLTGLFQKSPIKPTI